MKNFLLTEKFQNVLQVYPEGIRHIRADRRINEWKSPGKRAISRCAVNQRQVVISLAGGELVYFEMDPVSFLLHELECDIKKVFFPNFRLAN